jgi:FdhE protein
LIDLRQIDRAFYPKLEQITTLHLDMQAREKGYTNDVSILPDT